MTVSPTDSRPLWAYLRAGFWTAREPLRRSFRELVDSHTDRISLACGLPVLDGSTPVVRLLRTVSMSVLREPLSKSLRMGPYDKAAWVIATLAGFDDLLPLGASCAVPDRYDGSRGTWVGLMALMASRHPLTLARLRTALPTLMPGAERLEVLTATALPYTAADINLALEHEGWTDLLVADYPAVFARHVAEPASRESVVRAYRSPEAMAGGAEAARVRAAVELVRVLQSSQTLDRATHLLEQLAATDTPAMHGLAAALVWELVGMGGAPLVPSLPMWRANLVANGESGAPHAGQLVLALTVAEAIRRSDGVDWLLDHAHDADGLPADWHGAACYLLAVARPDDAVRLDAAAQATSASGWPVLRRDDFQAWQADGGASLVPEFTDERRVAMLHAFSRLVRSRDGRHAAFDLLLDVLTTDAGQARSTEPAEILAPLLADVMRRGTVAQTRILSRVRQLPDAWAGPLLQAALSGLTLNVPEEARELPCWNDPAAPMLALLEAGCLADVEGDAGSMAASLLRLLGPPLASARSLSELDRAVALLLLARNRVNDLLQDVQLLELMQGDPIASAVLASWTHVGRFAQPLFDLYPGQNPYRKAMATLVGVDSVSRSLVASVGATVREMHVPMLVASTEPLIRARAVSAALASSPDKPSFARDHLRTALLRDCSDPVGRAMLLGALTPECPPTARREVLARELRALDHKRVSAALWAVTQFEEPQLAGDVFAAMLAAYDDGLRHLACRTLQHVVALGGSAPVVALSIADDTSIRSEIGLGPSFEMGFGEAERRVRGLQALTLLLEARNAPNTAAAHRGRRMLLTPVRAWPPPAGGRCLDQATFEQLALQLRVLYVDAETGAIVAEVGEERTGEIVTAIFEAGTVAVLRAEWG